MMENNNVELLFEARSENEAFARVVAAAFVTYLDPTIEELQEDTREKQDTTRKMVTDSKIGRASCRERV